MSSSPSALATAMAGSLTSVKAATSIPRTAAAPAQPWAAMMRSGTSPSSRRADTGHAMQVSDVPLPFVLLGRLEANVVERCLDLDPAGRECARQVHIHRE